MIFSYLRFLCGIPVTSVLTLFFKQPLDSLAEQAENQAFRLLTISGADMIIRSLNTSFFLLFCVFALIGCLGAEVDPTYENKQKKELYKNGSIASEFGGFSLLGDAEKKAENTGLGVNGFLWRAALDTLAFLPIASADPFGGVITTDWHSAENAPKERVRLNVLILDRDLRADGVKVTVFRQTKEEGGDWTQAPVAAATASSLEDTILTRARQLKLAQREGK